MLLSELEPDAARREALIELAKKKHGYLVGRASGFGRKATDADSGMSWKTAVQYASLHLEAAETAVLLDLWPKAHQSLASAADALLQIGLPSGPAIAIILKDPHLDRHYQRPNDLISRWTLRAVSETTPDAERTSTLGSAALRQPQQLAYLAIANVGLDGGVSERFDELLLRLHAVRQAPFGRAALPIDIVLRIINRGPDPIDRVSLIDDAFQSVLQVLRAACDSIRQARQNGYLWDRLLSRGVLFDVDAALLLAVWLKQFDTQSRDKVRKMVEARLDAVDRPIAGPYLAAVQQLVGAVID
ncbi:hypothetical protein [Variovorax fucosicus]|uniref:hypothetical protein n=1 Tax=Variovorax fucosicus TaxID=3053517 RepID=UPI002574948E|nr:hypothetical protein [Variovorax sp. J22G47]MDM0059011.1 hypothetical protein [Variovorax sp. J22G47]